MSQEERFRCCGADCFIEYNQEDYGKCSGDVEVIDEVCDDDYADCYWVHSCEAHWELYHNEF